jgi:hypothetical protein
VRKGWFSPEVQPREVMIKLRKARAPAPRRPPSSTPIAKNATPCAGTDWRQRQSFAEMYRTQRTLSPSTNDAQRPQWWCTLAGTRWVISQVPPSIWCVSSSLEDEANGQLNYLEDPRLIRLDERAACSPCPAASSKAKIPIQKQISGSSRAPPRWRPTGSNAPSAKAKGNLRFSSNGY